ncbi:MAG: hypothetical protein IKW83_02600 [Muribaculaceae bacterium]|nr:hypothetical protein [Muribaculaceae bacterium]
MRTKLLLSAICSILLPLNCFGAVDLSSLEPNEDPVSNDVAAALLSKVYMHHPSLLSDTKVWLTSAFEIERTFKQTDGSRFNIITTAMVCMSRHNLIPTEYYLVTVQDNKVIDGALLGHNGDATILKMDFANDEIVYKPDMKIDFEFIGDSVKVKREYLFFSTARGGAWFNKEGTIYNPFIITKDGTINQVAPIATAQREDGDANYLSKDRKPTTYKTTSGEYYPVGMKVLTMSQTPVCQPLNMEELNRQAGEMMEIVEQFDDDEVDTESPTILSVLEFAKWSFNLGMRNGEDFLTWISQNPDTETLTYFIQAVIGENENKELEWLTEKINNLQDDNARNWWQKWMKENIVKLQDK